MRPWRSRGYLPHIDRPGLLQSVIFRLCDAVPEAVLEGWRCELAWAAGLPAADPRAIELRKRIAQYEDRGHGACWLRDRRIAPLVQEALLHFDSERYRIIAWCIMPNHVHALIEIQDGWPLATVLHSWKSYTAHAINRLLTRQGEVWFREYHDRFIRDAQHLERAVEYIEGNPVQAGLVEGKEMWRWSSAWERRRPAG